MCGCLRTRIFSPDQEALVNVGYIPVKGVPVLIHRDMTFTTTQTPLWVAKVGASSSIELLLERRSSNLKTAWMSYYGWVTCYASTMANTQLREWWVDADALPSAGWAFRGDKEPNAEGTPTHRPELQRTNVPCIVQGLCPHTRHRSTPTHTKPTVVFAAKWVIRSRWYSCL